MAFEGVKTWDVVVVPFPYSERLAEKRRPALVVSADVLMAEAGVLWIAMITGASKERRAGDISIDELACAGLPGASMLRCSKIATIEPIRILRRIGCLAEREQPPVARMLRGFIG